MEDVVSELLFLQKVADDPPKKTVDRRIDIAQLQDPKPQQECLIQVIDPWNRKEVN